MIERELSQKIDEAAALYAARLDGRALTSEEERAFEQWLSADVRHLGAFAKARAVCVHTKRARALGAQFDPSRFSETPGPHIKRRVVLLGGVAAAAVGIAVISEIASVLLQRVTRTYSTALGETRSVPLEDRSLITLNTASQVQVAFTKESREVQLLGGEALFDIAKDPGRPFTVEAGDTRIRAVGTSFTVQFLPDQPVRVLVREGIVDVSRVNAPTAPIVRVTENTRAIAPDDAPIAASSVAPAEVDRELTWRVGRIAFEGETLAEAVTTFARYSNTRIIIDDPSIASETITGLYLSTDPVGFAKAVAIGLDLKADIGDGEVRLRR